MPSTVDLENLEENITGVFLDYLRKGGVDTENLDAIAKIKHNTFEAALISVQMTLFKADKKQITNQLSLLPYNDNEILERLVNIYINLCTMCNKSTGLYGFSSLTGYYYNTIKQWYGDELNPVRMSLLKRIAENRQHLHINRMQDTPLGDVAVANNDTELGLVWAKNSAQAVGKTAVFIIPGEQTKNALPAGIARGITESIPETMQETG